MDAGAEPVADDELLFRRIPLVWYQNGLLSHQAFAPHKVNDTTGLSVSRAKLTSIHDAARGRFGRSYFIAVFRAKDLRKHGIEVVPRPLPDDRAHAEFPDLRADNRKAEETLQRQQLLVELCTRVEGPFGEVSD